MSYDIEKAIAHVYSRISNMAGLFSDDTAAARSETQDMWDEIVRLARKGAALESDSTKGGRPRELE